MIRLEKWDGKEIREGHVDHFKDTYGIDVTKLPEGLERFLSLAYIQGVASAYMTLLQEIQQSQLEETVTEL